MDCRHVKQHLSAYLDDELDNKNRSALETHLQTCDACRHEYQGAQQLKHLIQNNATRHSASPELTQRLRAAIQSAETINSAQVQSKRKLSWAWANAALSATMTVAFVSTLVLYLAKPSSIELTNQELISSHYRSLLADHLSDVASSDKHTVKPWFTGKVDFAPPVIDLTSDNFPLIGGRLDYIDQRTVVALIYRHDKHVINLFIWPDKRATGTALINPNSDVEQGYNLVSWQQRGMSFSAVSDLNGRELAQMRDLLARQIEQN